MSIGSESERPVAGFVRSDADDSRLHDRHVVGRESELSTLERFLRRPEDGFAVLALEGEPGIGKTTVWREGLRRAPASGYQVLACRAARSEAQLAFVGLGDLLTPVSDNILVALPEPQRQVLEVALLRAPADGPPPDRRAIFVAFLSLLRMLAASQPVLVAVDDAQWLDPASAAALEFVSRRLVHERVRMLTAIRLSDEVTQTFDLASGERRHAVRIGPLSVGALHEMIKARLGRAFARPTLIKIARSSEGNPFYALEIARAVQSSREPRAGEPLPVPDDLEKLVRARIRRLPADAQQALLVASAQPAPRVDLIPEASLEAAEAADIIRASSDGRVEFTHPLLASAVYASASPPRRRQIHRELAGLVDDAEERSRHLALAASGPNEEIATALEAGAIVARSRGAWESAAELLERARALSPIDRRDDAARRGIRAAEHHAHAGDRSRARALLEEILAEDPARLHRRDALRVLGEISYHDENFAEAQRLFDDALAHTDDEGVAAAIECGLAYVRLNLMDWSGGAVHAHRALELAEATEQPGVLAQALGYCAMVDFLSGLGVDWEMVERSLALEDHQHIVPLQWRPSSLAALLLLYVGRHSEARGALTAVRARATDAGDESDSAFFLLWLSWLETRSGNFVEAFSAVEEALMLSSLTGSESTHVWALSQRAFVRAHRGEIEMTRRDCGAAKTLNSFGQVLPLGWLAASLALLELSLGNAQAAWNACEEMTAGLEANGIAEPVPAFFLPSALEALLEIGQLDRAEVLIDMLENRGRDLDRAWALAVGARCRGLLLAARRDLAGAEEAFHRALREHDRLEMPFEQARTLLCFGRVQRRGRKRKAARASLSEALEIFVRLGAPLWAEKTRAELERTDLRKAPQNLTPTEAQVARLAATGLRNREIAERMFLSPKTVEANLARAYRKLGIRSRAELAALVARKGAPINS